MRTRESGRKAERRVRMGGKQEEGPFLMRTREKGREENNLLKGRIACLMREGKRKIGLEMSVQWRNRNEKGERKVGLGERHTDKKEK